MDVEQVAARRRRRAAPTTPRWRCALAATLEAQLRLCCSSADHTALHKQSFKRACCRRLLSAGGGAALPARSSFTSIDSSSVCSTRQPSGRPENSHVGATFPAGFHSRGEGQRAGARGRGAAGATSSSCVAASPVRCRRRRRHPLPPPALPRCRLPSLHFLLPPCLAEPASGCAAGSGPLGERAAVPGAPAALLRRANNRPASQPPAALPRAVGRTTRCSMMPMASRWISLTARRPACPCRVAPVAR